ncbi:hypothetical protein K432DRAFT_409040 [Lepidopterella palustris CBS 459.81]|uniref:SnoaL-like domain-containing protein n=1 Tax=Lepidopterella palustris CBS 459.81 TaxID=1314670 RepID=A0A8E2E142_9PEZI|nr:hypothetical protein K432DRAFT_409040 [Lepidopterella palustris CBS 459.81]
MASESTEWPVGQAVPESVKKTVSEFFSLADSKDDATPEKLAALFTEDGAMYSLAGVSIGRANIAAARPKSWNMISTRKHQPLKVYSHTPDFSDILIFGKISAELTNGNALTVDFIANFILTPEGSIKEYKSWGDTSPWFKAMGLK